MPWADWLRIAAKAAMLVAVWGFGTEAIFMVSPSTQWAVVLISFVVVVVTVATIDSIKQDL